MMQPPRHNIANTLLALAIGAMSLTADLPAVACDMFALLVPEGVHLSDWLSPAPPAEVLQRDIYADEPLNWDRPADAFIFLGRESAPYPNNDGYGLVCYGDRAPTGTHADSRYLAPRQRFYQTGSSTFYRVEPDSVPHTWQGQYHRAHAAGCRPETGATIVLAHARNATSDGTPGNHPFWFHVDESGDGTADRTFTFMHNGSCGSLKRPFIAHLVAQDRDWFSRHPLNWRDLYDDPSAVDPAVIIDSELLFHFLMSHVVSPAGDTTAGNTFAGLTAALAKLHYDPRFAVSGIPTHNFVLSDGDALFLYRSTPDLGATYNLEYRVYAPGCVVVKTRNEPDFTDLRQNVLMRIGRDGQIQTVHFGPDGTRHDDPRTFSRVVPLAAPFQPEPAYPNPFNPTTTIVFTVARATHLDLTIHDLSGHLVRRLASEHHAAGRHTVVWRGDDTSRRPVSSGVYIYRLVGGGHAVSRRLFLVR